MKYELIDKYRIKQITNCIRSMIVDGNTYPNMETSNPTDEMLDSLNIGMYLDDTAIIPNYNSSTHYIQTKYDIVDGKIVLGYDVLVIVPTEQELMKDHILNLNTMIDDTTSLVLDLYGI